MADQAMEEVEVEVKQEDNPNTTHNNNNKSEDKNVNVKEGKKKVRLVVEDEEEMAMDGDGDNQGNSQRNYSGAGYQQQQEEEEEDDGEDEVIRELDVFVNAGEASVGHGLVVLQYPLRPPWRSYDPSQLHSVKYKPQRQKLQLEYLVNERTVRQEEVVEGGEQRKQKTNNLISTKIEPKTTYAAAVLRDGQLHLTPIQGGIFQLRPSFQHLDDLDKERKKQQAEEEQEAMVIEDDDDMEEDTGPKTLRVEFKRRENEKTMALKQKSHAYMKQNEDEEPWVEMKKNVRGSREATQNFEKLFSPSANPIHFNQSKEQYLDQLLPTSQATVVQSSPVGVSVVDETFSLDNLKKLSFDQQLKSIFSAIHIVAQPKLRSLATAAASDEEIISTVPQYAVLVRGVWIARSDLLFPSNTRMAQVWDYMLLTFEEAGAINKKTWSEVGKIKADEAKEVLNKVAILEPSSGWVLKVKGDKTLAQKYPQVIVKYEKYWAERKKQILAALKPKSSEETDAGSGRTVEEQLTAFLLGTFKNYGVCTLTFLKQQLELLRKAESHPYILLNKPVENDILLSVLKSMASVLHGAYYLKSPGDPANEKYRDVILNAFKSRATLKKADIQKAAQDKLGEEIPAAQYTKFMKELAVLKGTQWIFKSGNGEQ